MTTINNLPELSTLTTQLIFPAMDLSTDPAITKKVSVAQLVALSAGPRGYPGVPGVRGPSGPQGIQGPSGPAITTLPLTEVHTTNSNYTIKSTDHGKYIRVDSVFSTATISLVDEDTNPIPVGTSCIVSKTGNGSVTFTHTGNAVILTEGGLSVSKRYGKVLVLKVATNTWELSGSV
jgi:hypothetical protein